MEILLREGDQLSSLCIFTPSRAVVSPEGFQTDFLQSFYCVNQNYDAKYLSEEAKKLHQADLTPEVGRSARQQEMSQNPVDDDGSQDSNPGTPRWDAEIPGTIIATMPNTPNLTHQ